MTALDTIRRASTLMKARAEALPSGRWEKEFSDVIRTDVPFGADGYLLAECPTVERAAHIAAADPAFMLAVATLLDSHADVHALRECGERLTVPCPALTVARRYLREDS